MNEAELILGDIFNCDRASLYRDAKKRLPPGTGRRLASILKRRVAGESLYYILGKVEFMGFDFRVTEHCLVPRPETELLVEAVVSHARGAHSRSVNILDIGTGSGCIAISLAKELKGAFVTATDISERALSVAIGNASRLGVMDRIDFINCNCFPADCGMYDCIVSNPPYIRSADIAGLSPEVRSEPRLALDGGPDGLHFYRQIIAKASQHLKHAGMLIMEVGFDQAECVNQLLTDSKKYIVKEVIRDYNGIDRIVSAMKD
jgi:release factor glutamine methyltransferase